MSKKIKKIFRIILLLVVFLAPILILGEPSLAQNTTTNSFVYTPMESIPGQGRPADFYDYISALYKFGIGGIGIAALLMITIGGYMYITSAGNTSSMEAAKNIITDAIVGVLLALSSYLVLYIINPELVQIRRVGIVNVTSPTTTPTTTTPTTCPTNKCSQINVAVNANSFGLSPAILSSIIIGGEGCNKNKSSAGACGYGQTIDNRNAKGGNIRQWCGIPGTPEQTCAAVQNDIQLDINCAAKLLKTDMMPRCGTEINQIASCYNTGKKDNCAKSENNYCGRVSAFYSTCTSK